MSVITTLRRMRLPVLAFIALPVVALVAAPVALGDAACPGTSCQADVSVTASQLPSMLRLGETTELQFIVGNAGPLTASQVFFGTNFHVEMAILSSTSDTGPCQAYNGNVSCQLGDIPAGGMVTVSVKARAANVGSGEMIAHAYRETGVADGNQTNNEISPVLNVVAPRGGVAKVRPTKDERILKTGGVRLRIVPHTTGDLAIDGYVSTRTGAVRLSHVDLRGAKQGQGRTVFLGTTPDALARIRRALRTAKRLRTHISVTSGGATSTSILYVQS